LSMPILAVWFLKEAAAGRISPPPAVQAVAAYFFFPASSSL
jgi:hypothetical protein